ncbi:protein translocase subunit SecD [Fastidiosibacter lacustris]|uniref:protein translocase subunit SecD n=1 Tax=Fastidiosibacter lacustris TaxID=2056695 RepID=UPI000E347534|nr:protein translocase subunit SecD [Fastidiosibacter lacustris]
MLHPRQKAAVNKYPLWKYLMILMIAILAIIYALPNLFGETPSLQISPKDGTIKASLISQIKDTLEQQKLPYKSLHQESSTVVQVSFSNAQDQIAARTLLQKSISNDYIVALNMAGNTPNWLLALGAEPMNLGLDLRGGMYLVLEADTQSAINARLDNTLESIVQGLKKFTITPESQLKASQKIKLSKDFSVPVTYSSIGYVALQFASSGDLDKAVNYLKSDYTKTQNNQLVYSVLKDKMLLISFNSQLIAQIKQEAISQVVTVMRNRINALGVAEASVAASGDSRVIIELPGLQDAARAKQILGGTSTASFYIVSPVIDRLKVEEQGIKVYPLISSGHTFYYQLEGSSVVSGSSIVNASPGVDHQTGQPIVAVQLSSDAAGHFREITSKHVGNLMGVMLVNTTYKKEVIEGKEVNSIEKTEKLVNAATIQTALGANFQITGLDQREANNLALMIRSGALQVPVHIAQEQQIGPTLGKQNIDQGMISIIVALVLVVLFMAIYYHLFGMIANVALVLNLILIIAIMSIIPGATLTLPGIAGIVLNLGMSIDGNVLVFERIREELRNGMPVQSAISAGYERAFGTIVDSNVTTLIVAIILFAIGTGAVKGFAVTLIIGIITSMFTAVTVSRAMTNLIYGSRRNLKKLSIGI